MTQLYSTRVQAPTSTTSAISVYDGSVPNPPSHLGRTAPDHTVSTDVTFNSPTSGAAAVPSLLLTGSAASRVVENSPRFVGRGKPFQISTLNTRTLNPISRMHELAHAASLNNNDIICIQEHRQHHQDLLSSQFINRFQLITASATKNTVNATVGGVGFLISPKAQKSLLSVEKINSRIILLHLNGNHTLYAFLSSLPTLLLTPVTTLIRHHSTPHSPAQCPQFLHITSLLCVEISMLNLVVTLPYTRSIAQPTTTVSSFKIFLSNIALLSATPVSRNHNRRCGRTKTLNDPNIR